MTRPSHIVTKRATCPDCGASITYRDQKGIRRFQPKWKRCDECGRLWR